MILNASGPVDGLDLSDLADTQPAVDGAVAALLAAVPDGHDATVRVGASLGEDGDDIVTVSVSWREAPDQDG